MSVNSFHHHHCAMLALCYLRVFLLELVVLGVEWQNGIFFFSPHTKRTKRAKIRESPLSALTTENKREGKAESINCTDRGVNG